MSKKKPPTPPKTLVASPLNAQQVADWLAAHPAFFTQNPQLVADLVLQHDSGKAISLLEKQIQVLRQRNGHALAQLTELIGAARDNEVRLARLHHLACTLASAASLTEVCEAVQHSLQQDFTLPGVCLALSGDIETGCVRSLSAEPALAELLNNVLRFGQPEYGPMEANRAQVLFPDLPQDLPTVARIPLRPHNRQTAIGVLAIGTFEAERLPPATGDYFVLQVAQLVAAACGRFVG